MKGLSVIAGIFSTILMLNSCTSSSVRAPSSSSGAKPIHWVITLHGVRGNAESYGEFHEYAADVLSQIDSKYEYRTINWTYPVGDKVETGYWGFKKVTWTPHTIAQKLNEEIFLNTDAKIKNFGPDDKISILAYSMGGMMIMNWYYDTMFNFPGSPELKMEVATHDLLLSRLEKVQNIIGLGPVYWGSVLAEFGWGIMGDGDMTQLEKTLPKSAQFCKDPEIQNLYQSFNYDQFKEKVQRKKELSPKEKQEEQVEFTQASVKVMCEGVNALQEWKKTSKALFDGVSWLHDGISLLTQKVGNMHASEFDNMRPTSEVIHLMRLGRMRHLGDPQLRERFKTNWTSIVGVFPCLMKKDNGVTCNEFSDKRFNVLNEGLITLLSGVKRFEADGPVEGPNAVADFLFYTETSDANADQAITASQFVNTQDLSKQAQIRNQEVFVENMHATVAPALMAVGGIGSKAAMEMLRFDQKLGQDVVIMNKECATFEKCEHPNFKHVLQFVTGCFGQGSDCDEATLNKYYRVDAADKRLDESRLLGRELGSYIVTLNIRLPHSFDTSKLDLRHVKEMIKIKNAKANYDDADLDMRIDRKSDPFVHQVGRVVELMSSYGTVKEYPNEKDLRVFLIGRAFPKKGQEGQAEKAFQTGIPLELSVEIPGTNTRSVTALIKPKFTTYVDMYAKVK